MNSKRIDYKSVSLLLRVLSPAIIVFGAYFVIRIMNIQPIAEEGFGDFITSLFFLGGASVAYFMYVLKALGRVPVSSPKSYWWLASSYFLMLLAFDEIYVIHEWLSLWLKIRDIWIFLLYGSILVVLIYAVRRQLSRLNLVIYASFVIFAGISIVSDTFLGEGTILVFSRVIDYEQIAESIAAFLLAAAFISIGVRELSFWVGTSSADVRSKPNESEHMPSQERIRP